MPTTYKYQASASWVLHQRGIVRADDSIPYALDFTVPPEFGGEPGLWTPEHLLLAAVASCYVATFRGTAEASKMAFRGIDVTVEGVIEKQEGSLRFTKIVLRPEAAIDRQEDYELARRLLDKAERGCLIARSLSSEIQLQPKVFVETPLPV